MPYTQQISASLNQPTCLMILLDQSDSMNDDWGGGVGSKSEACADAVNKLLDTTITRCTKDTGVVDYFEVGVIGYGQSVGSAFKGNLSTYDIVKVSDLRSNAQFQNRQQKVPDGAGGLMTIDVEIPIWLDPVAANGSPMEQAFEYAYDILEQWISEYPDSFPPMIFNVVSSQPDKPIEAKAAADKLMSLSTNDGNVLLFNVQISDTSGQALMYTDSKLNLDDPYAQYLFDMSSVLPPPFVQEAMSEGYNVSYNSRGFAYNSDIVELITFLDIGTRQQNEELR